MRGTIICLGLATMTGCYSGLSLSADTGPGDASTAGGSDGSSDSGDDGGSTGGEPSGDDDDDVCLAAGEAKLSELTAREYDSTVRDLLGTSLRPGQSFVADGQTGPFDDNAGRSIVDTIARQYRDAAEDLAANQDLSLILPCTPADETQEDSCALQFVQEFGARAYRRPLSDAQVDRLMGLYASVRDDPSIAASFDEAISLVLEAMLQSPLFLHHLYWGEPQKVDELGRIPLTDHELASRLSYFIWDSLPDEELLLAARDGALSSPDQLEAQARRMMQDPRATDTMSVFLEQWLDTREIDHTDKLDTLFPEFDETLRKSMADSLELFVQEVVIENPDATVADLLDADFVFVDATLAPIYGIEDDSLQPGTFVRIDDVPQERVGYLGQAAFLTSHAASWESSPVHRGLFVYDRLMCGIVIPPPDEIEFPEPLPDETPLDFAKRHMSEPGCEGCHRFFDPVGLGMEQYDSLGRFRTEYAGGQPTSADGEIVDGIEDELLGPFDGISGLANVLSQSQTVHACVAKQAMRFGMGSAAEGKCVTDDVAASFWDNGGNLHELMVQVVRSDAFRFRVAEEQEEMQGGQCP